MSDNNSIFDEIWIKGVIDDEVAFKFREQMIKKVREIPYPNHPLVVYVNSPGGCADAMASIIETMDEIQNPIYTVCAGKAMSAAAIILSHGDVRFCGQHSRIMIHEVSAGTIGNVQDMKNDTKEIDRLNKHFMTLLARNCNLKGGYKALYKILQDNGGREFYLDAEAARKFGIVDEIGTPNVEAAFVFVTTTHRVVFPKEVKVKESRTKE